MELTLKRAYELEKLILTTIDRIVPATHLRQSVFGDVPTHEHMRTVMHGALIKFQTQVADRLALADCAYDVRRIVSEANHRLGIDSLLRARNRLKLHEKLLNDTIKRLADETETDVAEIVDRIVVLRERAKTETYSGEEVVLSVVPEWSIGKLRRDLTTIRQSLADNFDRVAALNLNTDVSLSQDTVDILSKHDILV